MTLRTNNMNAKNKLTWCVSAFLLAIAVFGCGEGEQPPMNKSNEAVVERIDRVAAAEFKAFVEKYRDDIIKILEQNNFLPANLPDPCKHISWHLYKSANLYIENGMGTAKIMLSDGNNHQEPITLWFERKDKHWYLIVKDGYLTSSVSMNSKAFHLPPKIHESFTQLFPHMEYTAWDRWKAPVCKGLALIRLRTATEREQ